MSRRLRHFSLVAGAAALFAAGCAQQQPAQEAAWIGQARDIGQMAPQNLLKVLTAELNKSGPEGAIAVCNEKAPAMAKAASEQTGWAIRRVSLKNRNPKGVPDAWERGVLEDFERRKAAGVSPAQLERAQAVQEGGQTVQRYMRALPTQDLCVQCHGPADSLKPEVKAKLAALYPNDRGTGFKVGDLRGAITLKRVAP